MKPIDIEQHLTSNNIAFKRENKAEYSFQLKLDSNCRFKNCSAVMVEDSDHFIHLIAELPIHVNRSEYEGIGADLAELNASLDSPIYKEGFMLDVIRDVIRYEITCDQEAVAQNPDVFKDYQQETALYNAARKTISTYADEILQMVSDEISRIAENARRAEERAEREAKRSSQPSLLESFLKFIGFGMSAVRNRATSSKSSFDDDDWDPNEFADDIGDISYEDFNDEAFESDDESGTEDGKTVRRSPAPPSFMRRSYYAARSRSQKSADTDSDEYTPFDPIFEVTEDDDDDFDEETAETAVPASRDDDGDDEDKEDQT